MFFFIINSVALFSLTPASSLLNPSTHNNASWDDYFKSSMDFNTKQSCRDIVKEMFYFAYSSYMNYSFPLDELDPIHCVGRGYDHANPGNINVNDALGDFHLTLIDSLDSLVVMGFTNDFKHAVQLAIRHLSFDQNVRVQVFEATIRVLGGLLSAHLLITDPAKPFGDIYPFEYSGELLTMAHDLANRLLNVFDTSPSGLPYPRVFLNSGLKDNTTSENCLAGAGSLLLEFGSLSALLNDSTYASISRRVVLDLWSRRSSVTGLLGSTIDVNTGKWVNRMSGLGAGHDSFYEYLHKTAVLFGDAEMGTMFDEALGSLRYHLRSDGDSNCLTESGRPSVYWNVDMYTGNTVNYWIDSLQSVWAAILVHHGDIKEAVCQHALHYFIWQVYGLPPERYDLAAEEPRLPFYPLRPEFIESTYFLYRATRHPFYLHVGQQIITSLNKYARAPCGFATIHSVLDKSQEDRMESFFLSETLKYLYLLFDESNPINKDEMDYVFSTQAHLFPIRRIRALARRLNPDPFLPLTSPSTRALPSSTHTPTNTCAFLKLPRTPLPLDDNVWQKIGKFVHSKMNISPI